MQKFDSPRRFIAGAVCPRCSAMDTIVVDRDTERRECVACGFGDPRPEDKGVQPLEPRTRVNRPRRQVETPAEVVTLVNPKAKAGPQS